MSRTPVAHSFCFAILSTRFDLKAYSGLAMEYLVFCFIDPLMAGFGVRHLADGARRIAHPKAGV